MFSALHVRIAHDAPSAEQKESRRDLPREADRTREQRIRAAFKDQPRGEELNDSGADRERKAGA